MTEEKKWLSADALAERWESPLIDLYRFLRQGLPAYTDAGAPVVDIKDCTSKPRLTKNQLRERYPISRQLIDWSDSPEAECPEEQQYEQWIDDLYNDPDNWIMVGPEPNHVPMSFESPVNHTQIDAAASQLRRLKFKLEDILEFEKANPVQPPCIFRIQGDHWHIVYLGNTLSPSRPIKVERGGRSFRYVHQLISLYMQHGNTYEIKANQLENLVEGANVSTVGANDVTSMNDDGSTTLDSLEVSYEVHETIADQKTMKELKQQLDELHKAIQRCKKVGSVKEGARLEKERDNLKKWIIQEYGGNLKKQDFNRSDATKQIEAARKRVSDHILRSFEQIGKYDLALSEHLRRYIKRGKSYSYSPDKRIEWDI